MSITVIKPHTIIIPSQSYQFAGLTINKQGTALSAQVVFLVLDPTGKQIDTYTLSFTGKDYNTFWNAFNTGTFIYQELAKALGLPNSQIPGAKTHETEFVNP